MESAFIYTKSVDWSLLQAGMNIPASYHALMQTSFSEPMEHGESHDIQIVLNGSRFPAKIYNIGFDRGRYSNHKDLLQIRYSATSQIAKALQTMFQEEYSFLLALRKLPENKRKQIKLPETFHSYVVLSSTPIPYEYVMEVYSNSETAAVAEEIKREDEYQFEHFANVEDSTAGIYLSTKTQKVRRLNHSIIKSLKLLYDNRCQITGERIGEVYGRCVIEAHHIEYFTKSLNNNTNNIILVNPSFHRIIHENNPVFDRESLSFVFPNGVTERVRLDKHLSLKV